MSSCWAIYSCQCNQRLSVLRAFSCQLELEKERQYYKVEKHRFLPTHTSAAPFKSWGAVQLWFRSGPCSLELGFWTSLFYSELHDVQAKLMTRNCVLGKLPMEVSLYLPTDSVSHFRWLRYSFVKVWETASLSLLFPLLCFSLFDVSCPFFLPHY